MGKSSMKIYRLGLLKGQSLAAIEEFGTMVYGVEAIHNQQATHSEGLVILKTVSKNSAVSSKIRHGHDRGFLV